MPDWKKASNYKFGRKPDRARWAWEFMRRNPTYRREHAWATQNWQEAITFQLTGVGMSDALTEFDSDAIALQYGFRWGQLGRIADPNREAVPTFLQFPIETKVAMLGAFFQKVPGRRVIQQHPDFATITFSLHGPISPQLASAKQVLAIRQKGKAVGKPVHKGADQWPLYLRILDADEAGAASDEIISTIQQYVNLDTIAAQKRLSTHRKRAIRLRDDPLRLVR